ncbi:LamG domain-containing protein [Streptomyces sp. NBS 14/10]|uniref:LamG domain-containing protein n=1 Tax=Streptomyces sp. NBS 14/10 TaxID=1945643 RepID=UPI000B7C976F|nr:LamG domain-containing protein [Streptomyces sp. NBS 14/10]KAK1179977.1 LamG domain-containing protein [Streptomyces sp. NBS 14/10]
MRQRDGRDGHRHRRWARAGSVTAALTVLLTAGVAGLPAELPLGVTAAAAAEIQPVTITSDRYPEDDQWHDGAGEYGTFTFDAESPDAVRYMYDFTGQSHGTVTTADPGGPVSIRFMPDHPAPYILSVRAYDSKGSTVGLGTSVFQVATGRTPKAAWRLDDPEGSERAQGTGSAPSATAGPGVTFGRPSHGWNTGTAAALDGTSDAYLDAGGSALDTRKAFAVGAWVYLPDRPSRSMTVVSQDGTDGPGFALGYDDEAGAWAFRASPAGSRPLSWAVSGGAAPRQSWIHLLGVYDAEAGSLRLYVNGRLVKEDIQRGRTVASGTGGLQIGREGAGSGYTGHLRGTVADVRAYDRVVPSPEADELGAVKPHQVAYWPLESAIGGVAPDMDPKRPDEPAGAGLSLRGGASIYTTPDPGCDPGTDPDCVVDPDADALRGNGHLALNGTSAFGDREAGLLAPEDSFSITARARLSPLDTGEDQTVLSLSGHSTQAAVVRYSASAHRWELAVTSRDDSGATVSTARDAAELPSTEGQGDHLALAYDATTREVRLYVNGQLAGGQTLWTNSWDLSTTRLDVGRSATDSDGGDHFSGAIDEVRVFQGALNEVNVSTLSLLESGSSLHEPGDSTSGLTPRGSGT